LKPSWDEAVANPCNYAEILGGTWPIPWSTLLGGKEDITPESQGKRKERRSKVELVASGRILKVLGLRKDNLIIFAMLAKHFATVRTRHAIHHNIQKKTFRTEVKNREKKKGGNPVDILLAVRRKQKNFWLACHEIEDDRTES
jgi:hypothetical protein